ncbi:MAG: ABC transporter permease [Lachnospirales bacterium]
MSNSRLHDYAIYVLKRIFYAVLTLWAVVTITFILMKAIPGDPFTIEGNMSEAAYYNLLSYYNLDKPWPVQYLGYLKSVATFDFGPSMVNDRLDANYYITNGLPVTMELGMQAALVAVAGGFLLGILAALHHNKVLDYLTMFIAIIGVSVPSFIMARLLTLVLSPEYFPVAGWNSRLHTVLPTIALAALPMAQVARLMRSSMLEVLSQDYIKTAKAKGLRRSIIILKHAVRNAILPVVSILGTVIASLLTGSFVIEKIFVIPGMGDALIKSIGNRDYPIIMASTVVYCIVLVILTLIVDLLYPIIDPRIDLVSAGGVTNSDE